MYSEWTSSRNEAILSCRAGSGKKKKGGQASNPLPACSELARLIHPLLCGSVAQWVSAALSHAAEPSGKSDRKCAADKYYVTENKRFGMT